MVVTFPKPNGDDLSVTSIQAPESLQGFLGNPVKYTNMFTNLVDTNKRLK